MSPTRKQLRIKKKDPYELEWNSFVSTNKDLLEELRSLLQGEGSYNHSTVRIIAELYRLRHGAIVEQFFKIGQITEYNKYYLAKREAICLELSEAMRKAGIDPEPFYK